MNLHETIFILSAENTSLTKEQNHNRTMALNMFLNKNKIPHKELKGSYKGTEEVSFLIVGKEHENLIIYLAKDFTQKTYLKSYPSRETYLIDRDGKEEYIGKLCAVSEDEAMQSDAWTYCHTLKTYYVARK